MTDNPYAIPLEQLEARVRVPVAAQAEVEALPGTTTALDWGDAALPVGDGGAGGDCD